MPRHMRDRGTSPAAPVAVVARLWRPTLKLLHWGALALVLAVLLVGINPVTRWGVVAVAILWGIAALTLGISARPGPKLSGWVRRAFVPLHAALIGLLAVAAVIVLRADPGPATGVTRGMGLTLLAAVIVHGGFHVWRHVALHDGALRAMLPRAMHRWL
ncbi:hypothetical protein OCGS_0551 [Oceaniovalibus guishaninsula JLT2003]|uniref:Cytochrome b561 bacterial/Ni-hydrogenase domain-containing protein n=1 Tax=Oceaniovalibus guishaninsula JLT2003 TaxID=1231392 RepID=K2GS64_9RHOB|nr:hypothetical protein [Oceaniovalibus guishaninsula]EKE45461.1 hypothetical protein OCGS_0551 [Oceaniovalibus guishaninsula JLT2003]